MAAPTLNCFSINPENFKLCILEKGDSIYYYDSDGKTLISGKSSSTGNKVKEFDYQTMIQNYGLPFNFSILLHIMAQDVDFMKEFLEMAIKENEKDPIILTYVESTSTTTLEKIYNGHKETTYELCELKEDEFDRKKFYSVIMESGITSDEYEIPKNERIDINNINDNVDKYYSVDYYKQETISNAGSLYVTKADTWLKTTSKEISELETPRIDGEGEEPNVVVDISREQATLFDNNDEYLLTKIKIKIKETQKTTIEGKRYTVTDNESKINVDNFVNLIKKYPKVRGNLESAPNLIFSKLQENENTQRLEKVMRYVLSMLTGNNYGVTTLEELEMILRDTFNFVRGTSTENYIKAWENGGLWLYETGQSENIPLKYLTADGSNYIVYEDGSAGHNNIAYGWATFITNSSNVRATHPIYGEGYYNWEEAFASEGIDVKGLYEGAYVDKEKATIVFQKYILPRFIGTVDDYLTTHLPEYEFSRQQKDALTSICYQYGNISGFADAYKSSLNPDGSINAEKLRTSYSRFNYSSTINDRKYANWLLFTQGKYIDRAGNELKLGGSIVEAAYAVADHFINSGVDVHYAGSDVDGATPNGRHCIYSNIVGSWEKPIEQPETYGVVCATFVALSIWQAGLMDEATINQYGYNACGGIDDMITKSKYAEEWETILFWDDLQEGDIVWMEGHVFIYMNGDKCLDQGFCVISSGGSDNRGNLVNASGYRTKFIKGYRYIGK